jgi:translation initiation factor 2B subunit (eIF-2B alpha/beta/delta family)
MAYEDVLRELDILIESNKDTLERFIKQLNFVYNNLSDNHPLKESMRKYIDYVENEQGVS